MPTDPPLTQQHRDLLTAAGRRPDQRLVPPARVTGGARRRLAEKLVALGVAEAVVAVDGPIWASTPAGDAIGLGLTEAGLAIGAAATGIGGDGTSEPDQERVPAPVEPRSWTKIARVLALLRRGEGADLHTLSSVTAWLPHTTRAALTGLRRKGYAILSERRETDGRTIYRIAAGAAPELACSTAEAASSASALN